jgi:hypothetical protein
VTSQNRAEQQVLELIQIDMSHLYAKQAFETLSVKICRHNQLQIVVRR